MNTNGIHNENMMNTSGGNNSSSNSNNNAINNNSTSSNIINSSNLNGGGVGGSSSTTSANSSINMETKSFLTLLKRPLLASRDYENIIDDDYLPNQLLYDYSTLEAWYVNVN